MSENGIVIKKYIRKINKNSMTVRRLYDRNSNEKEHRKGIYG